MRLFDVYMAVDWSSTSSPTSLTPRRDALWLGESSVEVATNSMVEHETYWRTRRQCVEHIQNRLLYHTGEGRRVFLGFDFAYGYPKGFSKALGLHGNAPPWRQVWDEISRLIADDESNRNNRFQVAAQLNGQCGGATPGPFWGCPANAGRETLTRKSPRYPYLARGGLPLQRWRLTDRVVGGVQPVWKLTYPGSVGRQCLVGIPAVKVLRDHPSLSALSSVWPFETGFTSKPTPESGPFILHTEIWPGITPIPHASGAEVRDQLQVRSMVRLLRALDDAGRLGYLFERPVELSPADIATCIEEEGWILGSGMRAFLLETLT